MAGLKLPINAPVARLEPMICKRDDSFFESSNLPEIFVGLGLPTTGTSSSSVTTTVSAIAEHCNDCCGLCDGVIRGCNFAIKICEQ
jgi:hypothetical protein